MDNTLIIIPAYNEEETIKNLVEQAKIYLDVCVINDCSTDGTKRILNKIKGISIINHKNNTHIKEAIINGFRYALKNKYDYAITMDAGMSHLPSELKKFEKYNEHDLVLSKRIKKNKTPLTRKVLSKLGNYIYNVSVDKKICRFDYYFDDISSGYRKYSRKAMELLVNSDLTSRSFDFMLESYYYIKNENYNVSECEITYNYTNTTLNYHVLKDCIYMATKLFFKSRHK